MPARLIGPRRESGAFYKKRPEPKKKQMTTRGAKLPKPVKVAIQRMIGASIESKYVFSGVADGPLYNTLRTKIAPTLGLNFIKPCLPPLAINGTQSDQLIGTKMKVQSLKTIFNFNLASSNTVSQDILVRVFFLYSKNVKNYSASINGMVGSNLLRTGSASEEDWIPSSGIDPRILNHLPLNKNAWVGTSKTFRLTKNGGTLNGQTTGAVPVIAGQGASIQFTHDWKCKKTLTYDETDTSSFPENFLPLVGMVAWYPDGTTVGAVDTVMPVYCQFSHHMWYKDA